MTCSTSDFFESRFVFTMFVNHVIFLYDLDGHVREYVLHETYEQNAEHARERDGD
jgi:hypothetical protein